MKGYLFEHNGEQLKIISEPIVTSFSSIDGPTVIIVFCKNIITKKLIKIDVKDIKTTLHMSATLAVRL